VILTTKSRDTLGNKLKTMRKDHAKYYSWPGVKTIFKSQIRQDKIVKTVARYYQMTELDLLTKPTRKHDILIPRQIAWKFLYEKENMSYTEIGKLFGKTHATILSGIKKINNLMEVDNKFRYEVNYVNSLF